MTKPVNPHCAFATRLVEAAMAAEPRIEPLVGPRLSRAWSVVQSSIIRHGLAIQTVIADHLAADARFEVLRDHPMPLTQAAVDLIRSKTDDDVRKFVTLPADGAVDRFVRFDLLVVQVERGWVGVFDAKRGHGPTANQKRKAITRDLLAARMTLPDYAQNQLGFSQARVATSAVIDIFGEAGFDPDMTLSPAAMDRLFEGPVSATVKAMTAALIDALHHALPDFFAEDRAAAEVIPLFSGRRQTTRRPRP